MANTHKTLASLFRDTANAIRTKTGSAELIQADNFPAAIQTIQTGSALSSFPALFRAALPLTITNDTGNDIILFHPYVDVSGKVNDAFSGSLLFKGTSRTGIAYLTNGFTYYLDGKPYYQRSDNFSGNSLFVIGGANETIVQSNSGSASSQSIQMAIPLEGNRIDTTFSIQKYNGNDLYFILPESIVYFYAVYANLSENASKTIDVSLSTAYSEIVKVVPNSIPMHSHGFGTVTEFRFDITQTTLPLPIDFKLRVSLR